MNDFNAEIEKEASERKAKKFPSKITSGYAQCYSDGFRDGAGWLQGKLKVATDALQEIHFHIYNDHDDEKLRVALKKALTELEARQETLSTTIEPMGGGRVWGASTAGKNGAGVK